jgi:hypothetical protein
MVNNIVIKWFCHSCRWIAGSGKIKGITILSCIVPRIILCFYLPALPHEVVFIPSYVYNEWPVLNWYQFEFSFSYACKLLIFTPLIKSTMRWCEYESVYKEIVPLVLSRINLEELEHPLLQVGHILVQTFNRHSV